MVCRRTMSNNKTKFNNNKENNDNNILNSKTSTSSSNNIFDFARLTVDDDINCNIFINGVVDSPTTTTFCDGINANEGRNSDCLVCLPQQQQQQQSAAATTTKFYVENNYSTTTTSQNNNNKCYNNNKTSGILKINGAKIRARSADYYPTFPQPDVVVGAVSSNNNFDVNNCLDDTSNDRSTSSETTLPHLAPVPSCVALKGAILALYRLDDFELHKIGQGFFSEVYKVRHKVSGDEMVLKSNIMSSNRPNVLKEVQLMRRLKHPNVLRFKGVCVDNGQLHALTEYCNGGSLDQFIKNKEQSFIPWSLRANLSLDIARGMQYVHSCDYIHRDLTSKNVLLKGDGFRLRAVIADFGLACKIPKPGGVKLEAVGTPYWMGPECLNDEMYNEKADVFSYGIILCEMIARIDADPDVMPRTATFGLDYLRYSELCPPDTPVDLLKLAFQCCLMDPNRRPSFEQAVPMAMSVLKMLQHFGVRRTIDSTSSPSNRNSTTKPKSKLRRSNSDVTIELLAVYLNHNNAKTNFPSSTACRTNPASPAARKSPSSDANRALAHSIAAEDPLYKPSFDGANPFAGHRKFAGGRKIVADLCANRTNSGVLPNEDEEEEDTVDGVEQMINGLLPRCSNLETPVRRANSLPGSPLVHSSWLKQWQQQRLINQSDDSPSPHRKNDWESRRRMSNVFVKIDRRFVESKSSQKKQPIKRSITVSDSYHRSSPSDEEKSDEISLFTDGHFFFPLSPCQPSPVTEEDPPATISTVDYSFESLPKVTVIADGNGNGGVGERRSGLFDDIKLSPDHLNNIFADETKKMNNNGKSNWKNDGDPSPDSPDTSCVGSWQNKCLIL